MAVARRAGTAEALRAAGREGIQQWLQEGKVRYQSPTIGRLLAWAANAAEADPLSAHLGRVWQTLHDDWLAKTKQIARLERDLAEILVKTPRWYGQGLTAGIATLPSSPISAWSRISSHHFGTETRKRPSMNPTKRSIRIAGSSFAFA